MCKHRFCTVRWCIDNHFLCSCVCDMDHESAIKKYHYYISLPLLTSNAPLRTGKCTPRGTCTPGWEPLVYKYRSFLNPEQWVSCVNMATGYTRTQTIPDATEKDATSQNQTHACAKKTHRTQPCAFSFRRQWILVVLGHFLRKDGSVASFLVAWIAFCWVKAKAWPIRCSLVYSNLQRLQYKNNTSEKYSRNAMSMCL